MNPAQSHEKRPMGAPSKKSRHRTLFNLGVLLVLVLLGLSASWLISGSVTSAGVNSAALRSESEVRPASPGPRERYSTFFGFLEFDWDPNAPGGVPGFDPWPQSQP
mgnify:CR=1 FL=1